MSSRVASIFADLNLEWAPIYGKLLEIHKLNAEGVTLVIVEHNVDFIMSLCRRVIVLDAGRKIAEGPPALIRSDPGVLAAYLGQTRAAQLGHGGG